MSNQSPIFLCFLNDAYSKCLKNPKFRRWDLQILDRQVRYVLDMTMIPANQDEFLIESYATGNYLKLSYEHLIKLSKGETITAYGYYDRDRIFNFMKEVVSIYTVKELK